VESHTSQKTREMWGTRDLFTGFANSVFAFASFRFLLGVGEGFNWPAASKTVAEWFPSEERSLAVAIFDSGSSVGGALAALVIPWIALAFGGAGRLFFPEFSALCGWRCGCASTIRWTVTRG
jgi:sugar phosphate permease